MDARGKAQGWGGGEGGGPRDLVTANVREGNEADEKDLEQHSSHG